MTTKSIPEGYHTATAYLSITGAKQAIAFYQRAFGAVEVFSLDTPTGEVAHAEITIGDSRIMISEPCEESPLPSPEALGGSTIGIYLYVEDVDAVFSKAIAEGAETLKSVEDQFYGDRVGTLKDPFGHIWFVGTHKEDLSLEEIQKRAAEMFNS